MITTVHPARRHRRAIHGEAAVTTAANTANPMVDTTWSGATRCRTRRPWPPAEADVVDLLQDDQREQHGHRHAAAASASKIQLRRTTATTAPPTSTTIPRIWPMTITAVTSHEGERLDPLDEIGDESDDGLVEQGTDEHDDQQRPDGDGQTQDVGRGPGRPVRLGRDDLRSDVHG